MCVVRGDDEVACVLDIGASENPSVRTIPTRSVTPDRGQTATPDARVGLTLSRWRLVVECTSVSPASRPNPPSDVIEPLSDL